MEEVGLSEQLYGINIPAPATLRRYGLSLDDWCMTVEQDVNIDELWHCPVCDKTPPHGKTVNDHYHVRGWKKMVPEERKKYVRGVICSGCNYFILDRHLTLDKARGAVRYLERFEQRRSA